MLFSVRQFGVTHADSFPAATAGAELLAAIAVAIADMQTHSATQAQHARAAKEKTTQKNAASDALREMMEAIARTARAIARKTPGIEDKFPLPSNKRAQDWLAAARAFVAEAEPLKDEFISRGMAPGFVEDFKSRIRAVEQSVDGRAQKSAARVSATVGVAEAAERGRQAVRDLGAVVLNLFEHDAAVRAEWESASHIERAAHRAEKEEPLAAPEPAKA
jgi:hypothetical protein